MGIGGDADRGEPRDGHQIEGVTYVSRRQNNFCLGVSGSGVEGSRNRANPLMLGLQLMNLWAGLEESGRHSVGLPKTLGRAAGGTCLPELVGSQAGIQDACYCSPARDGRFHPETGCQG